MTRDWFAWHEKYDDPTSWQSVRLATVQERIKLFLDTAQPGPLSVISMCAGQGTDLIPVLALHPRRDDVTARLVELDPANTTIACRYTSILGLPGVDVVTGDAALTDHYDGFAPADLLLICGVFPHISGFDITSVIDHAPSFVKKGGTVIWTMHHRPPDLVPDIADAFASYGFEPVWATEPEVEHAVCECRQTLDPAQVVTGRKMFTFIGVDVVRGGL